jgi:hypothetical protein
MNLLTESPTSTAVSLEDGGVSGGRTAVLEIPRQDMRFCIACDCDQIFMAAWVCEFGLVGCCLGCGAESVKRFTRVNSEVA